MNKTQTQGAITHLRRLLEASESDTLEFKSRLRAPEVKNLAAKQDVELDILKSIAGLLNHRGGALIVGVNDDGTPNGKLLEGFSGSTEAKQCDNAQTYLADLLESNLGFLAAQCTRARFEDIDGHTILLIECPFSIDVFPVYVSQGQRPADRVFCVRSLNATRQVGGEEQIRYIDSVRNRHDRTSANEDQTVAHPPLARGGEQQQEHQPRQDWIDRDVRDESIRSSTSVSVGPSTAFFDLGIAASQLARVRDVYKYAAFKKAATLLKLDISKFEGDAKNATVYKFGNLLAGVDVDNSHANYYKIGLYAGAILIDTQWYIAKNPRVLSDYAREVDVRAAEEGIPRGICDKYLDFTIRPTPRGDKGRQQAFDDFIKEIHVFLEVFEKSCR